MKLIVYIFIVMFCSLFTWFINQGSHNEWYYLTTQIIKEATNCFVFLLFIEFMWQREKKKEQVKLFYRLGKWYLLTKLTIQFYIFLPNPALGVCSCYGLLIFNCIWAILLMCYFLKFIFDVRRKLI